jgi:tetratricopeptide (TPR) repeat protein
MLLVPFVSGVGFALPVAVYLGLLWPLLRARERAVYVALMVALVAAPFAGHLVGRLANPLRDERGPLYGIASLHDEAWSPARQASLERLAAEHPDNPFVQFGLGWSSRQGRDLATAETAYQRALVQWPTSATVLNNLGNVMVEQGRPGAAIEVYRRAIAADPSCAAAHFNLSQIYTRQFEYRAATEAAARASALDFELVKAQQALGTDDGVLPLADLWIPPAVFWRSMLDPVATAGTRPELPYVWRGRIETSGLPFAGVVLALGLASLIAPRARSSPGSCWRGSAGGSSAAVAWCGPPSPP